MQIQMVIDAIKKQYRGCYYDTDTPIDPQTTRNQIFFGDLNQECIGIVGQMYMSFKQQLTNKPT